MNPSVRLVAGAVGAMIGFALPLALGGCHRATEADCEEIVDKIVELELKEQGVNDPATIETRKTETKAKKRQELIQSCVGKRVSVSAMRCIHNAKTSTEITDRCLR